ncbi:class F sortase [Aquipuribacter sp. MA13-6]|uniref:class F sortase n=1 Tax=unclassified Aquipuribacter TaxID=2635084 RepID=UPI003EEB38B5
MSQDVGRSGPARTARRPGRVAVTALAVALLVGGGTAVALGLSDRGATPVPPALAATAAPSAAASSPGGPSPVEPSTVVSPPPAPAVAPAPEPAAAAEESAPVAAPVSVSIPAIDVTSDLLHLGLREDGSLEVPEGDDFDLAAWFDGSPRPGEVGPAVIEGHVSSASRGPSVFFDLATLQVGDTVEVAREDGSVATFEVYDLQQFPKDAFPTVQVYGPTEGPELRLITCGGTIVESSGRFDDNIIVFAREV